jgi:hypothetical protein
VFVIDDKLGELQAALTGLGLAALRGPEDSAVLDQIALAVAPLRLPADVQRLS